MSCAIPASVYWCLVAIPPHLSLSHTHTHTHTHRLCWVSVAMCGLPLAAVRRGYSPSCYGVRILEDAGSVAAGASPVASSRLRCLWLAGC